MRKITLLLMLGIVSSLSAHPQSVADRELPAGYVSDGCSLFFDGDWVDCCVEHDKAYFFGGTKEERKAADKKLKECVAAKGHKHISRLMYLGVRIGGAAFIPTPYRWGFGKDWKKPIGR